MFRDRGEQILVFDVGGSHISCGLFDPSPIGIGKSSNLPATSASPAELLSAFDSLPKSVLADSRSWAGVSIAMPNPFDYERGVSQMRHKHQLLYGVELRPELARLLQVARPAFTF